MNEISIKVCDVHLQNNSSEKSECSTSVRTNKLPNEVLAENSSIRQLVGTNTKLDHLCMLTITYINFPLFEILNGTVEEINKHTKKERQCMLKIVYYIY